MIIVGFILCLLGWWLFPEFIPEIPARLDSLVGGVGVVLIVIGLILLVLSLIGRPVGGRRYWY